MRSATALRVGFRDGGRGRNADGGEGGVGGWRQISFFFENLEFSKCWWQSLKFCFLFFNFLQYEIFVLRKILNFQFFQICLLIWNFQFVHVLFVSAILKFSKWKKNKIGVLKINSSLGAISNFIKKNENIKIPKKSKFFRTATRA